LIEAKAQSRWWDQKAVNASRSEEADVAVKIRQIDPTGEHKGYSGVKVRM
jgi:hypothetical protein